MQAALTSVQIFLYSAGPADLLNPTVIAKFDELFNTSNQDNGISRHCDYCSTTSHCLSFSDGENHLIILKYIFFFTKAYTPLGQVLICISHTRVFSIYLE